ncbi:MAG: flagellar basal body P-ring protein FlgI [Candidatus Pacebacteria bacterium]|nr:flagellar basal body P-ring protein FlgI [Candidatus Paceibacterota bacterium]
MKQKIARLLLRCLIVCMAFIISANAQQGIRVKDVAAVAGLEDVQLFGYGIVVGLSRTGDCSQTIFTNQTVLNMLKNMGIEMPSEQLRTRNVAAVMVTGNLEPFKRKGTKFDITVSSMGDATSLEGGTLILTYLQGPEGNVYASAQGPLSTGGYDVRDRSLLRIAKNHACVGRIPDGAIVQREYEFAMLSGKDISLSLSAPDFTTAVSMATAINNEFNRQFSSPIASAQDAATVTLNYDLLARDSVRNYIGLVPFISRVENVTFNVATQARVIINERTGTIVAGGNVRISQVAVTQGGVKVEVLNTAEAVQPQPFTNGQTEVLSKAQAIVDEKDADMVVLNGTATVSDLAHALNSLGVTPIDVIAIFQAIKEAGALHGQLVVM